MPCRTMTDHGHLHMPGQHVRLGCGWDCSFIVQLCFDISVLISCSAVLLLQMLGFGAAALLASLAAATPAKAGLVSSGVVVALQLS